MFCSVLDKWGDAEIGTEGWVVEKMWGQFLSCDVFQNNGVHSCDWCFNLAMSSDACTILEWQQTGGICSCTCTVYGALQQITFRVDLRHREVVALQSSIHSPTYHLFGHCQDLLLLLGMMSLSKNPPQF